MKNLISFSLILILASCIKFYSIENKTPGNNNQYYYFLTDRFISKNKLRKLKLQKCCEHLFLYKLFPYI